MRTPPTFGSLRIHNKRAHAHKMHAFRDPFEQHLSTRMLSEVDVDSSVDQRA